MKEEEEFSIKITDKGALLAISQTVQTLIQINILRQINKPKSIKDLLKILIEELKKYIAWIEKKKELDETVSEFNKDEIKNIIKTGKEAIKMTEKYEE